MRVPRHQLAAAVAAAAAAAAESMHTTKHAYLLSQQQCSGNTEGPCSTCFLAWHQPSLACTAGLVSGHCHSCMLTLTLGVSGRQEALKGRFGAE